MRTPPCSTEPSSRSPRQLVGVLAFANASSRPRLRLTTVAVHTSGPVVAQAKAGQQWLAGRSAAGSASRVSSGRDETGRRHIPVSSDDYALNIIKLQSLQVFASFEHHSLCTHFCVARGLIFPQRPALILLLLFMFSTDKSP